MRPAVPPKVTGQDTACRVWERASPTLRRPETQLTSVKVLATKGRYAPSGTSPGRSGPFGAVRLAGAGERARPSARAFRRPLTRTRAGQSRPPFAGPMGRPMVSVGDEVSASLLAGSAQVRGVHMCR